MAKSIKFKDKDGIEIYPCPYYPVGSIYMSVNNINPADFFGGKWERIQGKFLLGANDGIEEYNAGKMGGEVAHKLTVDEMPSHGHNPSDKGTNWVPNTVNMSRTQVASGSSGRYAPTPDDGINGWKWGGTSYVGGGKEHNNMPPFLSVYIWKRIE